MASQEIMASLGNILSSYGIDPQEISSILGISLETTIILAAVLLSAVMIWSLIWKGLALWKSAKEGSKNWFVIILVINTLGILEILYIYVFSKIKLDKKPVKKIKPEINRKRR